MYDQGLRIDRQSNIYFYPFLLFANRQTFRYW